MTQQPLRIVHVHLGIKGGAERFFVALVRSLAERGVKQKALIFPNRVWRDEISDVCDIHEFGFSRSHISRFFTNRKISRINRQFGTNVMMSWMPQATRWIPDDPKIFTLARLGDYPERLDYFVNCDCLVCNTPDIAQSTDKIGWDLAKTRVISNFTDTKPAEPIDRSRFDTPEDAFLILGMGRFVDRKGFDTLIEAASQRPNAYLWLLGEGEEEERLRTLARERNFEDRLRLLGWTKDPAAYLAACDAFCIPSRHEPLGNVVLEAWAAERPVVATASEGPSWLIQDGENGLLAPIDGIEALTEGFRKLEEEPQLAEKLVENGRESLAKGFSREVITDAYLNFFMEEVEKRS